MMKVETLFGIEGEGLKEKKTAFMVFIFSQKENFV